LPERTSEVLIGLLLQDEKMVNKKDTPMLNFDSPIII
jgi:hypothetical protein